MYMPRRSGGATFYILVVVIFFLLLVVYWLWFRVSSLETKQDNKRQNPTSLIAQDVRLDKGRCGNGGGDPLSDPYSPPVRCDAGSLMQAPLVMTVPGNSVPINIPTRHYNTSYNQIGIITNRSAHKNEILPIMGRRTATARDKWQYYTVAGGGGGGNLQTKLPVRVKGRNCSGEYGCDEISDGDDVYVEGYQENFRATVYENGLFSYIP